MLIHGTVRKDADHTFNACYDKEFHPMVILQSPCIMLQDINYVPRMRNAYKQGTIN